MRRRFIADTFTADRASLVGPNAQHLARVLRARIGQEFEISAGGIVRLGRITAVADDLVEFELGAEIPAQALPPVTLVLAIFKFDRMEWAIEKATELGVSQIVPLIARRTESHLAQAAAKRVERWRRIAHEAAQQSRRTAPPTIAEPVKLKDALAPAADFKVLLAEAGDTIPLKEAVRVNADRSLALAVGPEGGWTNEELKAFSESGWIAASLGPTILRAETATIAALAIASSELMS